ncbi:hypothetical protein PACILC2_41120 [Paenibacillus cisolokensis]|uniref:HPt domain-containing protein n=1 Tax=Paenibacillus cisolokensis TaxID=1658519 RepID=A0ABQ4NBE4_9BACL|nr:Hpt domain-containing protein [Paenibacillus cisolokensis]GIQ65544.1 hypothetical protein PACILC2_41120 [Paenibacillus cisolokensis]
MRYAFHPEDVDLLKTLLDEWKNGQEDLDKRILKLEACSADLALADDIYNRVHGIKRGSSFLGLDFITKLSHDIETVLVAVREKNAEVDSELIDHLLICADLLNHYTIRLSRKVKEHDRSNDGAELVIDFDDDNRMNELAEKTNAILNKQKQREIIYEAPQAEISQSEALTKTTAKDVKEQFLFETYKHIDKIENQILGKLEKEEPDRDAINELFRAIRSIKEGTDLFIATVPEESPHFAIVKDFRMSYILLKRCLNAFGIGESALMRTYCPSVARSCAISKHRWNPWRWTMGFPYRTRCYYVKWTIASPM